MQNKIKNLHVQRKFWKPHWKISLTCWAFYCVNDNTNVDLENPQIMHCILCHKNPVNATNLKTQVKCELISYFKTNGISSLKKHVNANHGLVAKMFERN